MQDNCKCNNSDFRFRISDKLRVPSTSNKVRFRKFLDDCPIFPNCVPPHLENDFKNLLRKVKYFDKVINGKQWTKVSK